MNHLLCPVCGHDTFDDSEYENEICPECYREYYPTQVKDPTCVGGANCHSLNEYRNKYFETKAKNPLFSCRHHSDRTAMINWDQKQ